MKFIVSITTVLFILLSSTLSWGGVDGKGLYCIIERNSNKFGVQFIDGSVKHIQLKLRNDKWIWKTTQFYKNYHTSTDNIYWSDDKVEYTLDRETLILRVYIERSILDNKTYERFDQCEVYSPSEFTDFTEKMRNDYQQWYDDQLKDKKI